MIWCKYNPTAVQAILDLIEIDHFGRAEHECTAMDVDHCLLLDDVYHMYMMEEAYKWDAWHQILKAGRHRHRSPVFSTSCILLVCFLGCSWRWLFGVAKFNVTISITSHFERETIVDLCLVDVLLEN
jgi:hypothetical protein